MPVEVMVKDLLKSLVFDGDEDGPTMHALRFATEVLGLDSFHSKVFIILTRKDKQVTKIIVEENGKYRTVYFIIYHFYNTPLRKFTVNKLIFKLFINYK